MLCSLTLFHNQSISFIYQLAGGKSRGGGGGGYSVQMTIRGTCRKHGSQFRPFGISMTPYFFRFGGIRMGGKSLLVYQWGLITVWYINGS